MFEFIKKFTFYRIRASFQLNQAINESETFEIRQLSTVNYSTKNINSENSIRPMQCESVNKLVYVFTFLKSNHRRLLNYCQSSIVRFDDNYTEFSFQTLNIDIFLCLTIQTPIETELLIYQFFQYRVYRPDTDKKLKSWTVHAIVLW